MNNSDPSRRETAPQFEQEFLTHSIKERTTKFHRSEKEYFAKALQGKKKKKALKFACQSKSDASFTLILKLARI